jgi:hypothetical protein
MPGTWHEVMPNLEALIKERKVQGEWPAARDEWGSWANKLETVSAQSLHCHFAAYVRPLRCRCTNAALHSQMLLCA